MNLYYNHIVDRLIKNIGITRKDLYNITRIESKRKFLAEINLLLAERRIIKEYGDGPDRFRYSPRVLKLYEYEKNIGFKTAEFQLFYFPNAVLEKELEYINNGTQPEGLEFELQIAGYQLKEKHKFFFECHNDIKLNFNKFNYYLWAEYLDPFFKPKESSRKNTTIIYIDNNRSFAIEFIKNIKEKYLPHSNWLLFASTVQAMSFLETKLEIRDSIDLIITENNEGLNGIEFIEAIRELKIELEKKYIHFSIPVMAFTKQAQDLSFLKKDSDFEDIFFHFLKSEELYLLGNVIGSASSPIFGATQN
ncbi:MAG: hypothetical protein ABIN01_13985 [Ferruginibacter sp.]